MRINKTVYASDLRNWTAQSRIAHVVIGQLYFAGFVFLTYFANKMVVSKFSANVSQTLELCLFFTAICSEIVMVMMNWQQDFMSSNSVCNHTRDEANSETPATRSSDFVNHSYDYKPNWTPLGPITVINHY